jgi:methyl-accepting chemotaxis protein
VVPLLRFSSLSTRLVVAILVTASLAFTALVGLTLWRLTQGLERQATQLARLSEAKLRQRLDGEARLARARVERLFADAARRLESIAQRADVVRAVATGNSITISELLGRAARLADLDGIMVVDTKLGVLGADREAKNAGSPHAGDAIDILAASQALQRHPLARLITPLLAENDRQRPHTLQRMMTLDADTALAIGGTSQAPFAVVAFEPIFDDFGDVFAAFIGHRALRARETTLQEFSGLEGAGLIVLAGNKPISWSGIESTDITDISVEPVEGSLLSRTSDGAFWARCTELYESWRLCALAPAAELHTLRDELVRVGEIEGRSLAAWLSLFAILSLILFAGITLITARRISRPLMQITEAVRAVARGDWKSEVASLARKDEVGDIARAVAMLQRSLEERDRLRSDVAQAESVKKRREELEDAIRRFDRVMRSVLLSVSDCVETMDETARELARMSAVAEGEAAEAAFVSESTVSNVAILHSATDRLSTSISDTAEQIRKTADILAMSSTGAQSASTKAEHLAKAANGIDGVIGLVEQLAAQINAVALNATLQGSRTAATDCRYSAVAADLKGLAARVAEVSAKIIEQVTMVRGASSETADSVRSIAQRLTLVQEQTQAIAFAMERQDIVTREIATSVSAAANGTINVSSSVERLKATIEEARGASMKVVTKATDMADEAHRLDSTVKSFLREVTA